MKKTALIMLMICTTACAEWQTAKRAIGLYGETAADESLEVSRWKHCQAETIGAIRRYYDTPEKMDRYNQFCNIVNQIEVPAPELPE